MDLRAVYEKFGGDYDCVINRLHNEERIKKYLLLFLKYNYNEAIQNALTVTALQALKEPTQERQ